MKALTHGEDSEPLERVPVGPLYVPVRPGPAGCTARLFRTPLGRRTAVGFTSAKRLTSELGPDQEWVRLSEPALRALTSPLGVDQVTVDPRLTADGAARPTRRARAPRQAAAPRPAESAGIGRPRAVPAVPGAGGPPARPVRAG